MKNGSTWPEQVLNAMCFHYSLKRTKDLKRKMSDDSCYEVNLSNNGSEKYGLMKISAVTYALQT